MYGISIKTVFETARRFAAGRFDITSSGSERSRSLDTARFLEISLGFFISSSLPDVGGVSEFTTEAWALNNGVALVVPVPDVGEGDTGLLAELRVNRGMLESAT